MKSSLGQSLVYFVVAVGIGISNSSFGQVFQELYSFAAFGQDGDGPNGALVQAKDGSFYGTTMYGGTWNFGTVFGISQSGEFTTIASLNGTNTDQHPVTGLVEASDGNFYFATIEPSRILKMTPSGSVSIFGDPGGTIVDEPLQASDGYLYLVDSGDEFNYGFVFRGRPDGTGDELLHQFDYNASYEEGIRPSGGLIEAPDGSFYGVTSGGGAFGYGVVYRVSTNGTYTVVWSFSRGPKGDGAVYPYGRLLHASDGNYYGTAGGNVGTIFKMTPDWSLTTLAHFDGANGENPNGGLIEANDGNFYGTATDYGACGGGTVFKATPDGSLTALISFNGTGALCPGGPFPGATPYAGLIQGTDGNLYGTCGTGGTRGAGNVFRIIMPGPQLSLARMGEQTILSWRTNYTGFTLGWSDDLNSGKWQDSTNDLVVSGNRFFVTNSVSIEHRFFKLKK